MEQTLFDTLNTDIKTAMKAKEKEKLTALRYVKSLLIENKTSLKPIAEMDVLIKHYKKLSDSMVNYPKDHPQREAIDNELKFISIYMPKAMDEVEVQALIKEIASRLDKPNMGMIMKELSPQIKGKFDGKKATELVKNHLN